MRRTLNRRRNFAERIQRLLVVGRSFAQALAEALWDRRQRQIWK